MLFNSYEFYLFLAVVYPLFLLIRRVVWARNAMLLVASYFFYGWWDWRFLGLIAISTIVDYLVGLALKRSQEDVDAGVVPKKGVRERLLLTASMVTNLGLLGVFKYYDFFVDSLVASAKGLGVELDPARLGVILPVGISFYTFQTMSYTIDLFRGKIRTERNLLSFATYVAFFPQLVAGPIERAAHLLPQFRRVMPITGGMLRLGAYLILMGIFKKVVLADNAAVIVNQTFGESAVPDGVTGWELLLGVYAFAVQIYCDFSGYSDIARGLGKLMGIDIMVNFAMPYVSRDPSEFWRRWHISLSSWLRDYLYIPLGGNRKGPVRTYINLALTMLLGGLWHGAAWTFVVWGALHGAYLIAYRLGQGALDGVERALGDRAWGVPRGVWQFANALFFFQLVCIAWVFFRASNFDQAVGVLAGIWDWLTGTLFTGAFDWATVGQETLSTNLVTGWLAIAAIVFAGHVVGSRFGPYLPLKLWPPLRVVWCLLLILAIVVFGKQEGEQFIYFDF